MCVSSVNHLHVLAVRWSTISCLIFSTVSDIRSDKSFSTSVTHHICKSLKLPLHAMCIAATVYKCLHGLAPACDDETRRIVGSVHG